MFLVVAKRTTWDRYNDMFALCVFVVTKGGVGEHYRLALAWLSCANFRLVLYK